MDFRRPLILLTIFGLDLLKKGRWTASMPESRSISQKIEHVLLTADDAENGFLETVQRTGIAV